MKAGILSLSWAVPECLAKAGVVGVEACSRFSMVEGQCGGDGWIYPAMVPLGGDAQCREGLPVLTPDTGEDLEEDRV